MKEEYQDRIEDYLFERMSDTERLAFEKDLEKDAELRDQYEFVSMVKTALMLENIDNDVSEWSKAYREREAAAIAAQETGYKATGSGYERTVACTRYEEEAPRSSKRHVLYWISGIAAVFVVGFFMYSSLTVYDAAPSKQDNAAYSPHPQGISTIRGVDVKTENLLAKGDFQEALTRIETLEDEIATDLLVIERQRESRGAEEEELAEKQEMLKWRLEGLLILKVETLICLDRMDDAFSLIPQLDKIRQSESEFKEKADSLYNVLKK